MESVAQKFGLISYMTIEDVCSYAKCSERHIHQEIKRKNLKAHKPVREILFDPVDVATWVKKKVK